MGIALLKPTPGGRVHPELHKEISMIRTIAAALAAFCFVSFGAFAQGSTPTDTSTKTETKSDTKKAKKSKKAKKAKKADSASKDSSGTAAPK
jgi:hypothetical protein